MKTIRLDIELIRVDGGTQSRAHLHDDVIADYAERIREGEEFPPVEVFHDGKTYWLADGYHRYFAHQQANAKAMQATVHQGTQADAQWFSYGANRQHDASGLRRTNADKQRAVEAALRHPNASAMSDREIARHVGVSDFTVRKYREVICEIHADTAPVRTVTRAGRTYEMNTTNIGRRVATDEPAPVATATLDQGGEEPEEEDVAVSRDNSPAVVAATTPAVAKAIENPKPKAVPAPHDEHAWLREFPDIERCISDLQAMVRGPSYTLSAPGLQRGIELLIQALRRALS